MKVGFSCLPWLEWNPDSVCLQGVRAGSTEQESDLPGREAMSPWSLETSTAFRCCESVCTKVGDTCVSPRGVLLKLCVCVFPQEIFPSYTAQVNCQLCKDFSSPLPAAYNLPDSFPNSPTPQIWLIWFIFLRWRRC